MKSLEDFPMCILHNLCNIAVDVNLFSNNNNNNNDNMLSRGLGGISMCKNHYNYSTFNIDNAIGCMSAYLYSFCWQATMLV